MLVFATFTSAALAVASPVWMVASGAAGALAAWLFDGSEASAVCWSEGGVPVSLFAVAGAGSCAVVLAAVASAVALSGVMVLFPVSAFASESLVAVVESVLVTAGVWAHGSVPHESAGWVAGSAEASGAAETSSAAEASGVTLAESVAAGWADDVDDESGVAGSVCGLVSLVVAGVELVSFFVESVLLAEDWELVELLSEEDASLFVLSDDDDDEDGLGSDWTALVAPSAESSAWAIQRGRSMGYKTMTKTTIAGTILLTTCSVLIVREFRFDFGWRIIVWMIWVAREVAGERTSPALHLPLHPEITSR